MGIPVAIPQATIVFPHLWAPHAPPGTGSTPKFQVEAIIDPNNPVHAQVMAQLESAFQQVLAENNKAMLVQTLPRPWEDGNAINAKRQAQSKNPRTEVIGKYLIRPKTTNPVNVRDQLNKSILMDDGRIFGGCICNVLVDLYWVSQPNPGVFAGLLGVQLVRNEGVERLGTGSAPDPETMFQPVDGAPAPVQQTDVPPWAQ